MDKHNRTTSETELAERCKKGEQNAFKELFDMYKNKVFSTAVRILGNIQDSEDTTQDIFIKLFKNINNYRGYSSLSTWIYKVAVNTCLENGNAPVNAEDISGNVEVSNSFSPVNIENAGGSVIVENRHGNITIEDILEKESYEKRLVKLKTSFGVIRLTLPDPISASLTAQTTFGKIDCDFPVYLESTSSNALKISGKLGDEKDKIEIEGKNTSIYIKKF